MKVLSLGWGVQSTTLLCMAANNEIDIDVAIFSDTGFETAGTYQYIDRMAGHFNGLIQTIKQDHTHENVKRWQAIIVPAFTESSNGHAQLARQCTRNWKIRPIRRWVQAHRNGQPVTMMMGISTDECGRAKPSNVKYITNEYPLIARDMSRSDCISYLADHKVPIPPRSSCFFCPYHSDDEWRAVKNSPDWTKAVAADIGIRDKWPPHKVYLHRSLKPLADVDFRTIEEAGQINMFNHK